MTIDDTVKDELGGLSFILKDIQCVDEVMSDRRRKVSLQRYSYWTADGAIYTIEKGDVILYLTRADSNPINSPDRIDRVHNLSFYSLGLGELEKIRNSSDVLRFNLSELTLDSWDKYAVVHVNSGKDNKLNKRLLERIGNTKAYVLNPKFVRDNIKEGEAFAMPCYSFGKIVQNTFCIGYEFVRTPHCRMRRKLTRTYQNQESKVVPIRSATAN